MSIEKTLDELVTETAMVLSEWPEGLSGGHYQTICSEGWAYIHENVWLQRRKELINKPDPKDAPPWANWLAQDSDGDWYWHKDMPEIGHGLGMWVHKRGDNGASIASSGCIPAGHDWKETLERVNIPDTQCDISFNKEASKNIIQEISVAYDEPFTVHPDGTYCIFPEIIDDEITVKSVGELIDVLEALAKIKGVMNNANVD